MLDTSYPSNNHIDNLDDVSSSDVNTINRRTHRKCNCRTRSNCPLNNNCLLENVVYLATIYDVDSPSQKWFYIGISKGQFKYRWSVHKNSFTARNPSTATALSRHYWMLEDQGLKPMVKWSVIARARPPDSLNGKCYLCLEEKLRILTFRDRVNLLNKRGERMSKCRHIKKLLVHP